MSLLKCAEEAFEYEWFGKMKPNSLASQCIAYI